MSLKIILFNLFFTVLFSHKLFAANTLPEFTAVYAVEKFGTKVAEAKYQLRHAETGYKFTQNTKLYGLVSLFRNDTVTATSYIDNIDGQLLLKKHSYRQTGKEKNKDEDISVRWNTSNKSTTGSITGVVRGQEIEHTITTPVWEALSFQLPLMIEASTKKKTYPYNAIIKGEVNSYNFELVSQNKIHFADKDYQTLHMIRSDPHKNTQLHLWLAPELYNIPVVIENYRDGEEHSRMQLESVRFNNKNTISAAESDDDS